MGALTGITVVEMGAFSPVRLATRWMALLGADVISIEKPTSTRPGDFALLDDDEHSHWTGYQANKRSITLNLKTENGREAFGRLIDKADVFVEGHRPGTLAKLGADYKTLHARNPLLVYVSVTGFGQTGPYAGLMGHDANYQAMGGIAALTGTIDGPPVLGGLVAGDHLGGSAMATIGALAALWQRIVTGEGQHVDAACAQGLIGAMGRRYADEFWSTGHLTPRGLWNNWDGHPGYGIYETSDGKYVAVSAPEPWAWERFCTAVERPDLNEGIYDEDGALIVSSRDRAAELFATRTRDEWTAFNERENLGVTPVLEPQEVLTDPHFTEWGAFGEIKHSTLGTIPQVTLPFKMSASPTELTVMPGFGENTDQVFTELGYGPEDLAAFRAEGTVD